MLPSISYGVNNHFMVIAVAISIFYLVYRYKIKSFTRSFKSEIIDKLVGFIDSSLLYLQSSHISRFEYDSSFLFSSVVDKFSGDDLIRGKIDGVNIKFSDLHTQKKKKSSKGQTYYATIFKGLFFIADFNKSFRSRTIVLPDKTEKFLGNFAHFFQSMSSHGQLVKLDNPEFEKEFVTYSSDQIDARYILSHSLMKNLLELKKLVNENISISFNGSNIFIAIHKAHESFEPKIHKKVTNFDEIKDYFQTISIIVDIVKILSLDVKIWSKK